MRPSIELNLDHELQNEDEEPLSDAELLEWFELLHAELFERGMYGASTEHADGSVKFGRPASLKRLATARKAAQ